MNIIITLTTFALIAIIVTICTANIRDILKPIFDIKRYKLIVAFLLTIPIIVGLNVGILESLEIINANAYPWMHTVDICVTIIFLAKGAQAIHKLNQAFINYLKEDKEKIKND